MHTNRSENTSESNLYEKYSFIAPSANALKRHVESHTPDAFSCTQCDHRTKNIKLIERRVIRQHESRNLLLCNQCDFTTKYGNSMMRHKGKVHLDLTYPCQYCTFVANPKPAGNERHACNQYQYVAKAPRP